MDKAQPSQDDSSKKPNSPKWAFWKKFKKPSKKFFWAWIAYQAIKGTLTTSLIWIPLIWAWFHR